MGIIEIILIILFIVGVIIFLLGIWAGCIFLYGMIEKAILKKRVPDKLKKEAEDERTKREGRRTSNQSGRGEHQADEAITGIQRPNDNIKPEYYEQLDYGEIKKHINGERNAADRITEQFPGDTKAEERDQPDNRVPKRKLSTI